MASDLLSTGRSKMAVIDQVWGGANVILGKRRALCCGMRWGNWLRPAIRWVSQMPTDAQIPAYLQHESKRQLLGQCSGRAVLSESENGTCLAA